MGAEVAVRFRVRCLRLLWYDERRLRFGWTSDMYPDFRKIAQESRFFGQRGFLNGVRPDAGFRLVRSTGEQDEKRR